MNEKNVEERAFENRCRAEFDGDESLRDEFAGRFETYLAYREEIPGVKIKSKAGGAGCSSEKVNFGRGE